MQLEIAIFVTSLVVFLMMILLVLMGEKLNGIGSIAFVLSIFGLTYSVAGFF